MCVDVVVALTLVLPFVGGAVEPAIDGAVEPAIDGGDPVLVLGRCRIVGVAELVPVSSW